MNALMVAGAAAVLIYMFPSEAAMQKKLGTFFPMESISAIQPSWRTFNSDNLGGMMALHDKPSFIDSRFDTFEHHGEFADFLLVMYAIEPLEIFDKYRIDHVILPANVAPAYVLARTQGWTAIRTEKTGDLTFITFARQATGAAQSPENDSHAPAPQQ
jgi:hypothetical protein